MAGNHADGNDKPLYVSPEAEAIAAEMDGDKPPAWPKVIGIISIVFGSLGIICGGLGIGWQLLAGTIMANVPGGAPPALTNPDPINLAVGGLGIVWAIVQIVAGSMTAARKPSGRMAHLVWAGVALVLGAVGIYLQVKMNASVAQWCIDNPDSEIAKNQSPVGAIMGYACGGFFGIAYPLFTLVWFGLIKRNAASIAEGVTETAA